MKKIFLFILLLLTSIVYSQNKKIDSLLIQTKNSNATKSIAAFVELTGILFTQNFNQCIQLANEGIIKAHQLKDSISMSVLFQNKGAAFYFKGIFDSASIYYHASVQILEIKKNKPHLALAFNHLAKLYRKTKNLKRSLDYYDKALTIFEELNDKAGVAMIYNESGVVFEYLKDYDEAIRRYNFALSYSQKVSDSVGISYSLNFISGCYLQQKNFIKAEEFNLKSLAIREKLKDPFTLALSYFDMGTMYLEMKQYPKAIDYFNKSNSIAKGLQYLELQSENYKSLSETNAQFGNFKESLLNHQAYTSLKDSIYKIESLKQIEELSTQYETKKKEQQIQLQQFTIQRKNIFIGIIIGLFVLVIITGSLFYSKYKIKQKAKLQEEIFNQQELATKAVIAAEENERQRIAKDLHDGLGQLMSAAKMNLSVIQNELNFESEIQRKSFEKTIMLIDESCKEVRTVSHNMMPNALLKSGLASGIRDFINKLDARALKVNLFTEGLDNHLDENIEMVLYRIIQECVNNVIKHAKATLLDITIIKDEEGISVSIEDDGIGFDITDKNKFEGIGLKNISTRVQYLKGTVEWDSSIGKGTSIIIQLPL